MASGHAHDQGYESASDGAADHASEQDWDPDDSSYTLRGFEDASTHAYYDFGTSDHLYGRDSDQASGRASDSDFHANRPEEAVWSAKDTRTSHKPLVYRPDMDFCSRLPTPEVLQDAGNDLAGQTAPYPNGMAYDIPPRPATPSSYEYFQPADAESQDPLPSAAVNPQWPLDPHPAITLTTPGLTYETLEDIEAGWNIGSVPQAPKAMVQEKAQHDQVLAESDVRYGGKWTNSKRWMSEAEVLRASFHKMQARAKHSGFDKSPFLPRSPSDYAGFLAERKLDEADMLRDKIDKTEDKVNDRQASRGANVFGSDPEKAEKLMRGRQFQDDRSAILSMKSCFTKEPRPHSAEKEVEWPSLAELKHDGEERAKHGRLGRFLPPPRYNAIDPRIIQQCGGKVSVEKGTPIPFPLRELAKAECDNLSRQGASVAEAWEPAGELLWRELKYATKSLIRHIDG